MADIHIQQGEGFFDLVIQVPPTAEGTPDRIVATSPGPHAEREAGG